MREASGDAKTAEMTRDELFERYVDDALDDDALAELASRREEDEEFAARFDEDLLATGKFRKAGGVVVRIKKEDKGAGGSKDSEDKQGKGGGDEKKQAPPRRPKLLFGGAEESGSPAPKLIMGESAEMPKALQFLGVGEEPPAGFYDQKAEETISSPAPGEAVLEQESLSATEVQSGVPTEPPSSPEVAIPVEDPPAVADGFLGEAVGDIAGSVGDGEDRDESGVVTTGGFVQEAINEEGEAPKGEEQLDAAEPIEEAALEIAEMEAEQGALSEEIVEESVGGDDQDEQPDDSNEVIEEELQKLSNLDAHSSEYQVCVCVCLCLCVVVCVVVCLCVCVWLFILCLCVWLFICVFVCVVVHFVFVIVFVHVCFDTSFAGVL